MKQNTVANDEASQINKAVEAEKGGTVAVHNTEGEHITHLKVVDIQGTKGRVVVEDREGKRATLYEVGDGKFDFDGKGMVTLYNN